MLPQSLASRPLGGTRSGIKQMSLRIYIAGRVCLESHDSLVEETDLPGRHGRLVLAYLVVQRHRPVSKEELAEVLWPDVRPASWNAAINATVGKLRPLFSKLGYRGVDLVVQALGAYHLRLPKETWIDVHAAAQSLEDAHAAVHSGELSQAWSAAVVAAAISRRPFLASEDAPWIRDQRKKLRRILTRSLNYLAEVSLLKGDSSMACSVAEEAIGLEPFHEKAYQQLMRAHHLSGNDAEAIRTYHKLRALLADELGVWPSSATEEVKDDIMRRERRAPSIRVARTFVFTDIVGSTQLIEAIGDEAWTDVVRWHDETLRSSFLRYGGEEIDHAGDGFFVAFQSQKGAMDCAINIQRALRNHRRIHGFAPSVRIGLHSSEAAIQATGYKGKGVHEAARIASLAEGGQILASLDTIEAAGAAPDWSTRRTASLKGISTALDIAAVEWQ